MYNVGFEPRLWTFTDCGRPAVIFSNYDLSTAALAVSHWGINGYATQSARRLLTNIALWASSQTLAAPDAAPAHPATAPATSPAATNPAPPGWR
jgi:hypothetical protein